MSEDFTGGWSGSSSIIAPPLSLLDPRSSGKNKATGTLLKIALTNQLPVIQSPRSEEIKNKRSETHPWSHTHTHTHTHTLIFNLSVWSVKRC